MIVVLFFVFLCHYGSCQICFNKTDPAACNSAYGTCTQSDECSCIKYYHGCQCDTKIHESFLYTDGMVRVPYVTSVKSILDDFNKSSSIKSRIGNVCLSSDEYLYDDVGNVYPCPQFFVKNYNILGSNPSPLGLSFDISINTSNIALNTKYFTMNTSGLSHLDRLQIIALSEQTENQAKCISNGQYHRYVDIPLLFINGNCSKTNPEVCDCPDSLYNGQYCTDFYCGIFLRNSNNVCNQRGICVSPNICNCSESKALGSLCEYFECFGHVNGTCGIGGVCTSQSSCYCSKNYGGRRCQYLKCFEILENDYENVCSGHGACRESIVPSAPNICRCFRDYGGLKCDQKAKYFTRAEVDAVIGALIVAFITPGGISLTFTMMLMVNIFVFLGSWTVVVLCCVVCVSYWMCRKTKNTVPLIIDGRPVDHTERDMSKEEQDGGGGDPIDICAEKEFDPYEVIRDDDYRSKKNDNDNEKQEQEHEQNEEEREVVEMNEYYVTEEKGEKDEEEEEESGNESQEEEEEKEDKDEEDKELQKVEKDSQDEDEYSYEHDGDKYVFSDEKKKEGSSEEESEEEEESKSEEESEEEDSNDDDDDEEEEEEDDESEEDSD